MEFNLNLTWNFVTELDSKEDQILYGWREAGLMEEKHQSGVSEKTCNGLT